MNYNKNDLIKFQILSLLTLLVPINIYVIGNYYGAGVQFAVFRYQESYLGSIFITFFRDINYVLNGTITNKSAISIFIWFFGVIFLILAICLILILNDKNNKIQNSGIFIILAAIFFLLSLIIQYGPLLSGPAGTTIPIGIPVLIIIGLYIFKGLSPKKG